MTARRNEAASRKPSEEYPSYFSASAAAEYERAVDAFRSDEESHLVRPYIQNGNAFVTHKFRPLRKNNLVKVYIFFIIHYLWNNVNELRKKSAKKRGERRVSKRRFSFFFLFFGIGNAHLAGIERIIRHLDPAPQSFLAFQRKIERNESRGFFLRQILGIAHIYLYALPHGQTETDVFATEVGFVTSIERTLLLNPSSCKDTVEQSVSR